jgi:ribose transport system substrate-binding protein
MTAGCGGTDGTKEGSTGAGPGASARAGGGGTGPRLMFISNSDSDWWTAVEKGMADGGARFGAQVELRRNKQGSPEGQISLLEHALSLDDVKGVAISVLEAEAPGIADKMRELLKAGKIVIAIDSDGPADARRAYIGTNNRKAGEIAGHAAKALRPQGGKTVVFVGTAAAANAQERREGFFEGTGKDFTQLELFEDGADMNKALSNVENALSKHTDLDVLLGLYSYNAARIGQEVGKNPDLRKRVTVVTFDLDESAVGQVEQGNIDATVCQNPYEMGYQGVRLLKAYVEDDKATINEMLPGGATIIDTGVRVIVPSKDSPIKGDNVIDIKAMKTWLDSKGLKSS